MDLMDRAMKKVIVLSFVLALGVLLSSQQTGCFRSYLGLASQSRTLPPPKDETVLSVFEKHNEEIDEVASLSESSANVIASEAAKPDPILVTAPIPQRLSSVPIRRRKISVKRSPLYADNAHVEGEGHIIVLVSNDPKDTRRQKFLVRLDSGDHILVVYDLKQHEPIKNLRPGDAVEFSGEYFFGQSGNEVRIACHDEQPNTAKSWVKHKGLVYE